MPEFDLGKGSYTIDNTTIKAKIEEGLFYSEIKTQGELPTWTGYNATPVDVTGSVGTELSYEELTINALVDDIKDITLPGEYTLAAAEEGEDGAIVVGKAGVGSITATATVDLSEYLTDVTIDKEVQVEQ
jgi:hypothetical protein